MIDPNLLFRHFLHKVPNLQVNKAVLFREGPVQLNLLLDHMVRRIKLKYYNFYSDDFDLIQHVKPNLLRIRFGPVTFALIQTDEIKPNQIKN